jgi:hypothetical protein
MFHFKKPVILLVLASLIIFSVSVWVNSFDTGYFLAVFLGSYIILPFVIFILLLTTLGVIINKKKTGSAAK